MFISYAQNFEDVMLHRALQSISKGTYIDIGASHPDIDSVSRAFHEQGWRGIHVEPIPAHAAALRSSRPEDIVIEAVVTDGTGVESFFDVGLGAGISTCSSEIAERHLAAGFPVSTYPVKHISLCDIMTAHVNSDVHWMKIDVEGSEGAVIRSWKDSSVKPWIVLVESTEPMSTRPSYSEWEPDIIGRGYRFVYFDGLNRFYLSEDHLELAAHFSCGPNLFDGFTVQPHHWICPPPPAPVMSPPRRSKLARVYKNAKGRLKRWLPQFVRKLGASEERRDVPTFSQDVPGVDPGRAHLVEETLGRVVGHAVQGRRG